MPGPLHGFRILDLSAVISGPYGTMILADQGADVIKVEPPGRGDFTRSAGNKSGGMSASFLNNNRNKRSIAIDLRHPDGVAMVKRLATTCDVIVQNFRPGVVDRLGVGEDAIRAVAPDIIYVSISGFGETGPFAQKPVYDPIVQAISGLSSIQGGSDAERPRLVRTILPDKLTAITTAQAITAALLARSRSGIGQHVRVSMLDAVVAFLWSSDMGAQTYVGREVSAQPRRQLHRPDLSNPRRLHERGGNDQRPMVRFGARHRTSRMAGRPALRHHRTARPQHRRPAGTDPVGAAGTALPANG